MYYSKLNEKKSLCAPCALARNLKNQNYPTHQGSDKINQKMIQIKVSPTVKKTTTNDLKDQVKIITLFRHPSLNLHQTHTP